MKVPEYMQAMVLEQRGGPLISKIMPVPTYAPNQVLVKVRACGICRTDLHILDGELTAPKLPLILGPEIIGLVVGTGALVTQLKEVILLAFPGWVTPAAPVPIAKRAGRTFVKMHFLQGIH